MIGHHVKNPIQRRLVREVMRTVPTGFLGQFLVLAFTDLLFLPYLPFWIVAGWTLLQLGNLWLRHRLLRAYLRQHSSLTKTTGKRSEDLLFSGYLASLILSSLLWSAIVLATGRLPETYHFLVYALVIVLTYGATVSIGPLTSLYLLFVLPINGAMIYELLRHDDPVFRMAALFLPVTLLFSIKAARKNLEGHKGLIAEESAARMMKESFRQQAIRDPLTGLFNRVGFSEIFREGLNHAQRHRQRLALLFLDLDRFKTINDTHGHAVGDRVIETVGQRLTDSAGGDESVARISGDEFVILVRGIKEREEAIRIAEKILQAFANPVQCEGVTLSVEVSIGIAFYPDDGEEAETLMKRADEAMYRSKKGGTPFALWRKSDEATTPPLF